MLEPQTRLLPPHSVAKVSPSARCPEAEDADPEVRVSERKVFLSGNVSESVELLQHVASPVDEPCPGRGHRDASAAPLEQSRTDLALEALDVLSERLR